MDNRWVRQGQFIHPAIHDPSPVSISVKQGPSVAYCPDRHVSSSLNILFDAIDVRNTHIDLDGSSCIQKGSVAAQDKQVEIV